MPGLLYGCGVSGVDRPTLRDVAEAAGLSVTQTSRALNGHWDVAEVTKTRAREVADRLGYVPNAAARRLARPDYRADAIGLVLPVDDLRFTDPFFAELMTGIVEAAGRARMEVRMTAPLPDDDELEPYRQAIRARQVDGFVLVRTRVVDPRVELLRKLGVPFVAFGRTDGVVDYPAVDAGDDPLRPAVDHLVDLGHRRIACLSEPKRYGLAWTRRRSFDASLRAHGLSVGESQVIEADFHEDSGFAATLEVLKGPDPPTAIVAFNDLLALGALNAARVAGLNVPRQLSVIGFDDVPAARHASPPLTTFRQPASEIARLLCRLLLAAIEERGEAEDESFVIPELVIRESTGPPPS